MSKRGNQEKWLQAKGFLFHTGSTLYWTVLVFFSSGHKCDNRSAYTRLWTCLKVFFFSSTFSRFVQWCQIILHLNPSGDWGWPHVLVSLDPLWEQGLLGVSLVYNLGIVGQVVRSRMKEDVDRLWQLPSADKLWCGGTVSVKFLSNFCCGRMAIYQVSSYYIHVVQ